MASWNSGALYNTGILWGPAPPPSPVPPKLNSTHKPKPMKRQEYYPNRVADRPEWHENLAAKITTHGPTLGLTTAQVNQAVADNLQLAYAVGNWLTTVREFGPACTAAVTLLSEGSGDDAFAFPLFEVPDAPTLPVGVTVTPGALNRTFLLIKEIKAKAAYTLVMGLDMGIVGAEDTQGGDSLFNNPTAAPRIKVTAVPGATFDYAQIKFFKDGHEHLTIESRRGGGGWESLGLAPKSPFLDKRPLLVADQAEVREIRAKFFDQGQSNGAWCDVAKVTVGP